MYDIQMLRQKNLFGDMIPITGGMDWTGSVPDFGGGYQPPMDTTGPYQDSPENYSAVQEPPRFPIPQVGPIAPIEAPRVNPRQSHQDMMAAINEVYTPSTVDRDRFRGLLDNYPEFQQPSGATRWSAALMGIGAGGRQGGDPLKTMDHVLLGPYVRDVEEWKTKGDAFGKAAQYENTANVNERNLASTVVKGMSDAARLEETARKNTMQAEASMIRARAYDYSQRLGRGWDWDLTGPTAKKINKTTGEIIDTGLETGKMDEQTKIELQNEGRINAARVAAEAADRRSTAAGNQVYTDENGNPIIINPRTRPEGPVQGVGPIQRPGTDREFAPNSPREDAVARNNRLSQWLSANAHIENIEDYVTRDEAKNITMQPPPEPPTGLFSGFDNSWPEYYKKMEIYNQIRKILHPEAPPVPAKYREGNVTPSTGQPQARGGPVGDGAAEPGKVSPTSRAQQQSKVAAGTHLEVVDQSGRPVGIVPNSAAGRAEAARLGYRVR